MASSVRTCVVTGAFGYSGRIISRMLLDKGIRVRTLTNHPRFPDPFDSKVEVFPLDFSRPDQLCASLSNVDALINTYWVRFPWGSETHETAVAHTKALIEAAMASRVPRLVHISITNPSADSDLPYFRGKGQLEDFIRSAGISYAILRPTVLFGHGDILINNIAWVLRHFPVFGMPGRGDYKMQPVFVEDFAAMAVSSIEGSESVAIDAVGPEIYTFAELLQMIRETFHSRRILLPLPPKLAWVASKLIGTAMGDVILTMDEVKGLMRNLLVSSEPPTCPTRLSEWLRSHADSVGLHYASELARRR